MRKMCIGLMLFFVAWGVSLGGQEVANDDEPLPFGAVMRLGTTTLKYSGSTSWRATSFSADGETLACGDDVCVYLWEVKTGKLKRKLNYAATSLAFAPKGTVVALGLKAVDKQSALLLVDSSDGKELARTLLPIGIGAEAEELSFTPDGTQLIATTRDKWLRMWDAKTLVETKAWQTKYRPNLFVYSPNGNCVAYTDGIGVVIMDFQKNTSVTIKDYQTNPQHAAFFPDGKVLATCSIGHGGVRLWDVATGKLLRTEQQPSDVDYRHVMFSRNGKLLAASGLQRGGIRLWDASTGKALKSLPEMDGFIVAAISPDGRLLAAHRGKSIRIWDLQTGEPISTDEGHAGEIEYLSVFPHQGMIATGDRSGVFMFWDAATGKRKHQISVPSADARGAAFSPDGKWLAFNSPNLNEQMEYLEIHESSSGRKLFKLPGHNRSGLVKRTLQSSADGRYLLSWSATDFYLRKWDMKTGKVFSEFRTAMPGVEFPDDPDTIGRAPEKDIALVTIGDGVFTPSGEQFLLAAATGEIHFFDVTSGKTVRVLKLEGGSLGSHGPSMALSPTGLHVAVRPARKDITVHELTTGKRLLTVLSTSTTGYVQFSPDGRSLAVVKDKQLVIIEIATGKTRLTVENLPTSSRKFVFSPDGRFIVMAMEDSTALVWDLTKLMSFSGGPKGRTVRGQISQEIQND